MKKTVCYSGQCNIVITGFQEQYPVCTVCHLEVSEELVRKDKARKKSLEDNKIKDDDYSDMYDLMYGYESPNDPMGD